MLICIVLVLTLIPLMGNETCYKNKHRTYLDISIQTIDETCFGQGKLQCQLKGHSVHSEYYEVLCVAMESVQFFVFNVNVMKSLFHAC